MMYLPSLKTGCIFLLLMIDYYHNVIPYNYCYIWSMQKEQGLWAEPLLFGQVIS